MENIGTKVHTLEGLLLSDHLTPSDSLNNMAQP